MATEKSQWEEEGWCLVEGLFSADEVRAAQAVMPELFPTAEEFAADVDPERNLPFRVDSHSVMPTFPFESSALNRLVLHDKVIDLAQDFLGLHDIRLYQGMLSAKYSNGAPDDEQMLHVDYGNHTLGGAASRGRLPAPRALRLPERRHTREGGDPHGVASPDHRHPDREDLPQPDRVRPSLPIRGARLGPGRHRSGLPARRVSPGRADDRPRLGPLHVARLVQAHGHRLARLPGLARRV